MSVNRFRRNTPSAGLLTVSLPGESALAEIIDFLEYERSWRVVNRTEQRVRLRRVWARRDDFNAPLAIALFVIGVIP